MQRHVHASFVWPSHLEMLLEGTVTQGVHCHSDDSGWQWNVLSTSFITLQGPVLPKQKFHREGAHSRISHVTLHLCFHVHCLEAKQQANAVVLLTLLGMECGNRQPVKVLLL